MKKTIKKLTAWMLVMTLLLACGVTQAFAATKDNVRQYGQEGGYLAIGDSISRGCGADGFYIGTDEYEGGQYDMYFLRNVEGALPNQISQAVGCIAPDDMTDQNATFWPFCYPGLTTAMVTDLYGIDDGWLDEDLDYQYYDEMLRYFGWEGSFAGSREGEYYVEGECGKCGNIIELTGKADLITLQLGMCDVFYRAYRICSNGGSLADGAMFDTSSPEAIAKLVANVVKEMTTGFEYWKVWYPKLLERIMELNDHATIVLVGTFNLVNQLYITDDLLVPLGSAFSTMTAAMNELLKKWAKDYGVLYADVTNTEVRATELDWALTGDFMDDPFTGTHPTQKGYDYMVRQILDVLPAVEETEPVKGIVVDLGRFDRVDYVLLDGIPITNYTMDGYKLIIPTELPFENLSVGVIGEDGKLAVQTYQLEYKDGAFTAYRIWGNNDAVGFFARVFQNIIRLFKMLFEKIADVFKG